MEATVEMGGTKIGRRAGAWLAATVVAAGLVVATPGVASACTQYTQDGPVGAQDDEFTLKFTTLGTPLVVNTPGLLANDSGPCGTIVDVFETDEYSYGGAEIDVVGNGKFTYNPDPLNPFTGYDEVFYAIRYGLDDYDYATAYVLVTPDVRADTYYTRRNTALHVDTAGGVLANDLGELPDGIFDVDTTATKGAVTLEADGSFHYTPPANWEGKDTFKYWVWDLDLYDIYPGTATIYVDSTAATASITAPTKRYRLSTSVPVTWTGSDTSGIKDYEVETRFAKWNDAFGSWTDWTGKTNTTTTSGTFSAATGQTRCFRVRADDKSPSVPDGSWSSQKCTAIPLKSTALVYSSGWTKQYRSEVYGGVDFYTTTKGASFKKANMRAERIYLVMTKCATCGSVQVRWNNVVKANVNLYGSPTKFKQVIEVFSSSSAQTGTLSVHVTSATGKRVLVEGVAAYRD
jgi:hypothetical protein